MMTREEAQKFLADEMAVLETQALGPPEWRAQFRDAIAALEAEPKPLAVGYVRRKHLDDYADGVTETLLLGGLSHYKDDVAVDIILPAKQEATHA